MLRNYLKMALRSIMKNRLSSLINISGLALAIGCCLVVFVFIDWSFNQDTFHTKLDQLYVLEKIIDNNGNLDLIGESPAPMGDMLKNDFPQIKNSARIDYVTSIIKIEDKIFRESVSFVDDAFYEMLDFPVKWGNKKTFTDLNAIVLTDEMSNVLFGNDNPVGKDLNVRFNHGGKEIVENLTVAGVFEKKPYETSFYFSALIPFKKKLAMGMATNDDWSQSVNITFLETDPLTTNLPTSIQMKKYLDLYNTSNHDTKISSYWIQPLKTMNLHSYKLSKTHFYNTHIFGTVLLISIALSILMMVCFNYMNIAIASASNRYKEIGVRKSMGSSRIQIIYQFTLENFILCTAGVLLGLLLTKTIFLPWFAQIADFGQTARLFENQRVWIALFLLILITVIGGSAYPSIYISSLQPINIVKGNMTLVSKNNFRKILLGFQFFLTFVGFSMAISFTSEMQNSRSQSWGYDPTKTLSIRLEGASDYEKIQNDLKSNSSIKSLTGSVEGFGKWTTQVNTRIDGKELLVKSLHAIPGFATQFNIKINTGRDLNPEMDADITSSVLVNQAFLLQNNWDSALGKTITHEDKIYQIVGVMDNFRYEDFEHKIEPLILFGCKSDATKYLYVASSNDWISGAHLSIEKMWKKEFPNTPFNYYYQETVFDNYFDGFVQIIKILTASSLIMVIVSITGIFGLALLILKKKMKQISVRKVLGADSINISMQVLNEFFVAIFVSVLLGVPISYWFTNAIFTQFVPDASISYLPFMLTVFSLLVMTLVSVLWHLIKANSSNPTEFLKSE